MFEIIEKQDMLNAAINAFKNGAILIETDKGDFTFSLSDCIVEQGGHIFENSVACFKMSVFVKGGETAYRTVTIECKIDLTVYRISLITEKPSELKEFIFYKTFINAPAAGFLRCGRFGFYTGAENPFFSVAQNEDEIVVSYEPSLMLKAGECYESDAQFMGGYIPCGEFAAEGEPINLEAIQTGIKRTRFFNPCSEILLDRAEIKAMRDYVAEYYDVIGRRFDNILYYFFYPHANAGQGAEQERECYDQIDRFAKLQGDIIAFNPHAKTTLPTEEKPYWELLPKDSAAERIFDYAVQKGLRCGYYMGCAFNGEGGNAALLPFMPHKTEWKKRDDKGNIARENCLACDEYLDWWYKVQENTIAKYDLGYWAWDPGPGNGNDCFADNHGHLPGKGEYKGWRNSLHLLERLKTRFPDLFLQSFYGRKEYGFWGLKYFSQHEVYWEQTLGPGATIHRDFSDYRMNAHGTRLQNLWSMQYRFIPAQLGHGLVTRMGESYFDRDIEKANDLLGWKYSLISSIAYCGSVTHCNLPDKLEHFPQAEDFYRKWIIWARDNYEYCRYAVPIADDVSDGVIDGIARIHKDRGQLFLFNSSPLFVQKQLKLDSKIGFDTDQTFYFRILYCERTDLGNESVDYRGEYRMGDCLDIILPPYGAVVLEMAESPSENSIEEIPFVNHTVGNYWISDGEVFSCQKHGAYDKVSLFTEVYFSCDVKDKLEKAVTPNKDIVCGKLAQWKEKGLPFNFITAFPERLLVYIPIRGVRLPSNVALLINGKSIPVEAYCLRGRPVSHYAFIEDHIMWDCENKIEIQFEGLAENSFMGLYFEFPDVPDGMRATRNVVKESLTLPSVCSNPSLVIDALSITPDVIPDTDVEIVVRARTNVPIEDIEAVYFLHPTKPQMPSLKYDPQDNCWKGVFKTGKRCLNIFCNTDVYAWIKAKNGGIGPKKHQKIKISYSEIPTEPK